MSDSIKPIEAVMGPLSKVRNRLAEDTHAKEVGVDMMQFLISPGDEADSPHHARAIFTICEGAGTVDIEVPDDLANQLRNGPIAADEERANAAREDLEKLRDELKDPKKGIGLDG